jgi:hypothetical protein
MRMDARTLPDDCVLVRTPAGTRKMRDRAQGLPPKLRSVLFLVDGTRPVHALLERAGTLGGLLESQFVELLDLGLVECRDGKVTGRRAPSAMLRKPAPAEALAAIVGAKIRLIDALEAAGGSPALDRHAGPLTEARTWRDLAHRARVAAVEVQETRGAQAAAEFWGRAKQILVASRDGEAA